MYTECIDKMASIGDSVHFKCNVSDPLQINWDKDGHQFLAHHILTNKAVRDENFISQRIGINHDSSELNITHVLQDDAGVYTLQLYCNSKEKSLDN